MTQQDASPLPRARDRAGRPPPIPAACKATPRDDRRLIRAWALGSEFGAAFAHAPGQNQQLADLIGVTYQQAHKYERGINRVSAGRLYEIAQVLSVPIGYFFDGLDGQGTRSVSPRERMCLELARNFAQIPNERHQEALSQLARVLAAD